MESIVLSEFRERYPTGSLMGELIGVGDDSYIVRAIVEVEGKPIATGLAAASTVEEAEDRARMRALEVLGLSPRPLDAISRSTIEHQSVAIAPPPPHLRSFEISQSQPLEKSASEDCVGTQESDWAHKREDTSSEGEESIELADNLEQNVERLMNKTTLEIRRLGWSAAQGRRYLERTYEKRSRQHLTREELVEFLAYLESQPTP